VARGTTILRSRAQYERPPWVFALLGLGTCRLAHLGFARPLNSAFLSLGFENPDMDRCYIQITLTISAVKVEEKGKRRAGSRTLTLLASPLNGSVLQALAAEPKRLVDLRRDTDFPPDTTLRLYLRGLTRTEVVTKRKEDAFPGTLRYELGPAGRDLLSLADVLRDWLAAAPGDPLALGSRAAKHAIKALTDGWDTSMLRALAARPFSLTELGMLISGLPYPSLERRFSAMRSLGQVEAQPRRENGNGTPYGVTGWLRRGVAPIAAAARWEHIHLPCEAVPLSRRDAEAIFLLAIPLIRCLPDELSGSCRLAVETTAEGDQLSGVTTAIEAGRIVSCTSRLEGNPDASARAPIADWFAAVIECDPDRLELGGDSDLARSLLSGLHQVLFAAGHS
jgi:DNA-binding HxlR family transcriptional regulator